MIYINNLLRIMLAFILMGAMAASFALAERSPIGYWKTIDDVTGQAKSIIQIYANQNQKLSGRIIKIYPKPGDDQNKVCDACKGSKHNQKIVGMVILEDMQADGEKWGGGQILDPKNGKTYHCNLRLVQNGENLEVRGYIGIAAFGRTQTWQRVHRL